MHYNSYSANLDPAIHCTHTLIHSVRFSSLHYLLQISAVVQLQMILRSLAFMLLVRASTQVQ